MRVGVYLADLDPAYVGGLTTYAIGLVNGLLRNDRGHDVTVFMKEEIRSLLTQRIEAASRANFVCMSQPSGRLVERLTRLPGLAGLHTHVRDRRMGGVSEQISRECDVVLFPLSFMATYRLRVPSIVSFHDLQHELYPHFFSWRELRSRRVRFGATFRHATLLQASSVAMKNEALRVYADRVTADRVVVIPEGVDYAEFSAPCGEDARKTYGLPEEFIHYPAQLWHHKNHLRLLEAIDLLRTRDAIHIPLVLNGAEYEAAPGIRAFIAERGLTDQVFVLGKVPFAALRSLYQQASYVVSASLHESNCLPALEAAASGSPIILADIPPNRESAQVFQLRLFDPLDVGKIAATLAEAWKNRRANDAAVRANREAARRCDWTCIAGMYIDQAERLVGHANVRPRRIVSPNGAQADR
jgi:glycosyltransferase involved in cell wall biosynthesis